MEVVHTPDQDYTDFTKGLLIVLDRHKDNKVRLHTVALARNVTVKILYIL